MFWTILGIVGAGIGILAGLALTIVCLVAAGPIGAVLILVAFGLFLKLLDPRIKVTTRPPTRTILPGVNPPRERDSLD